MSNAERKNEKRMLHTVARLAAETDTSERHVRRAIKDGKIRIVRMGGAVRIPEAERLRILQRGF